MEGVSGQSQKCVYKSIMCVHVLELSNNTDKYNSSKCLPRQTFKRRYDKTYFNAMLVNVIRAFMMDFVNVANIYFQLFLNLLLARHCKGEVNGIWRKDFIFVCPHQSRAPKKPLQVQQQNCTPIMLLI